MSPVGPAGFLHCALVMVRPWSSQSLINSRWPAFSLMGTSSCGAYHCPAVHHVVQRWHPNVTIIIDNNSTAVMLDAMNVSIATENHSELTCISLSIECFLASKAHWLFHKYLEFNGHFETQIASMNYCTYHGPTNKAEYNTPTKHHPHCLSIADTLFNSWAWSLEQCTYYEGLLEQ